MKNRNADLYITDILNSLANIEKYIMGMSLSEFRKNQMVQDAVIRNFEIIGESVKRISEEFKKKYPEIPWRSAGAMRDVLIHDYPNIVPDVVWKTATEDLPKFKIQIKKILESQTT